MLDDPNPSLIVRAAISKNRKKSQIPLHPDVIKVLKQLGSESPHEPSDKVFRKLTRMRLFLEDLKRASISYKNGSGFLDFHSFRHTFATNLARSGADEVTRMKLMRHSDSRLTNNTYVDSGKLPTSKAVQSLPSLLDDACPEAQKPYAQLHAQKSPKTTPDPLQGANFEKSADGTENPKNKGNSHISSSEGREGQNDEMAPATGLEGGEKPAPPLSLLGDQKPDAQLNAQDTPAAVALQSIISRWPSLPENIRKIISAIVSTVTE